MAEKVKYDDLEEWAAETYYVFAREMVDATNKALSANFRGRYRVHNRRNLIYEGDNPIMAVQIYNDAR